MIAGVPLVCAGGVWLSDDPLVLRGITAAAAAAAVIGAVVMRRWDRLAGKQVAELTRGAASERWRHEEAVAELEGDLEESRELRLKLEAKLRAKRSELAGLRNEHAALLRRYANAETERASALEGRRRLAIEATAPAKALPAVAGGPTTPLLYLRANAALDRLARPEPKPAPEADSQGKPRAASGHYTVPAAAAVVPAAPARRVPQGGFDFFGTSGSPEGSEEGPADGSAGKPDEDLADVIGDEALAEQERERGRARGHEAPEPDSTETKDVAEQEVIDLTAHDETEQIDVGDLRSALRA